MLPAVCLFFALGFKEPMFFSIVGGALIALPSWKHARGIGKPVALVTVAGIAALTLFRFVTAYFLVYVPHIVGYHLFHPWGTVNEPLLLRTADLPRIVENMLTVSPFLPLLIASLWIGALAVLLAQANTRKKQLAAFARWLLASWLITLPVGLTGDFYFHHFVFAVPGYAGLALACLRGWDSIPHARFRQAGIAVLTVLLPLTIWTMPHGEWGGKEEWEREWAGPMRQTGRLLDAVMDACDVDRYFLLVDRPEGLYGFTRHSPYGPIFTQYGRFIGVSPVYLAQFTEALEHAEIAVITTDADTVQMDPHTVQYVEQSFSLQPWPCAKDLSQPLPYRFLFRVGARP